MQTNLTEDEDEFQDAVESPIPITTTLEQQRFQFPDSRNQLGTPQRPAILNVGSEWNHPVSISNRSQQNQSGFHTPRPSSTIFSTPGNHSSQNLSSHRERLLTLRRRMNNEFGNRDVVGPSGIPDFEVDDTLSTMSEAPSLQSWHQQIINKNETVVVKATDTMSTCAMSIAPALVSECFEHFKSPQPPTQNSASNVETNKNPGRTLIAAENETSTSGISSQSSCQKVKPPPIPSRDHMISPKTILPRVPPPLPPRNPRMKLPNPISIETEGRLKENSGSLAEKKMIHANSFEVTAENEDSGNENSTKNPKLTTKTGRSFTLPNIANKIEKDEVKEENKIYENQSVIIIKHPCSSMPSPSSSNLSNDSELKVIEEEPSTSNSHDQLESTLRGSTSVINDNQVSRSASNDELKMKSESVSTSFDPITLDVERRLSMKRNGQLPDDQISLSSSEDNISRLTIAKSGIGHATHFARNSVIYASGKILGAFRKVKTVTHAGHLTSRSVAGEDSSADESDESPQVQGHIVRPRKSKKGPFDFEHMTVEQQLDNEHTGAVWCIKFSICGRLMATAGQDSMLRIWVVKSHLKYFSEMRDKYSNNLDLSNDHINPMENIEQFRPPSSMDSALNSDSLSEEDSSNLFCSKPFAVLKGHTADILDLSWSKNYFLLSSGMDRTVKLWHLSRNECLCCFQHIDFVTCVAFLPKDDRYFLSGSLDGKLRLWHIPDKKVAVWNEVQVKFITAMTFVKNGKFVVVGTYNGRCYFYTTDQLKYHTVVDVRSTRGKNAKGHKVTGLAVHGDKLLVTSNDSRIRMYDIRDKALTCKFKGAQNDHSQIRAAFSPDGRHIICGSEDKFIYLWRSSDVPSSLSVRKDRNAMWERVQAHNVSVSAAVFAPRPHVFFAMLEKRDKRNEGDVLDYDHLVGQSDSIQSNGNITVAGHAIVSADLQGVIKVFINRPRQCKVAPTGYSKNSTLKS